MSSEQILTLRQILDNLNLIEPIYSQIVDKVVKSKTVTYPLLIKRKT